VLTQLDEEDFTAVIIALTEGVSPSRIAKAIRRGGYKISHSTIQEHKEKHCMCKGEHQWV
jgi:multisubunit Na+/H+ antiporter MnhG subunit